MRKRKLGSILGSKRGNAVVDTAFVMIILFLLGVFIVLGKLIFTNIDTHIDDTFTAGQESTAANETWSTLRDGYSSNFDSIFLIVFVGFWITTILASFMIDTHPIFFIVSIILLFGILIGSAMISNMWMDFDTSNADIEAASNTFPMMNFVVDNLLIFMIFVAASIMLVLYAKQQ